MFRRYLTVTIAILITLIGAPPARAQRNEGITVRGHWAIDVKNEDGTLASHHEFDNALTAEGKLTLAGLLVGAQPVAGWMAGVWSFYHPEFGWGQNVIMAAQHVGDRVVLTGSTKFEADGDISLVQTYTCSTAACGESTRFSLVNLAPRISHRALQTIDITVTISFAAAPHSPSF